MPRLSLNKLERHLYSAADRLRQEGLDAATYKDYIFGMLFLKRCSDVFAAEHAKIVGGKVEQGMELKQAEKAYGENPDYYDGFFVPERARWLYLVERLNDATESYGSVLDKALGALSEANESLEHVLDHISFLKTQGTKRLVSDDCCKDLVRHFSRHRLCNEDFQFSDLLGAAYEFLINMFAESAGKKGGGFYTPRDVIRLMVRVLKPTPGMSVYDPTCGSGGMLIISREFIEQSGGDPANLRLCGQVNDASAWSICRLNMLLHGVPGADIQLQDTLLHPQHKDAGELERFDRVIANPPFSQNYTRSNMEFPERFRWGWCPTSGKKGDLMFAQHMLAVCKPGGMVATVMPHSVLFRGGAEKEIRRKFLEQDLIEAVIGLPQNLFYGAGIPACILIMRPNLTGQPPNANKPADRRGKVLFINADAKADIARLKGEKEAFEQSNAPDDLDEEELAAWNYAKDIDRQMRELKAENKDALKEPAKLEKQAAKPKGAPKSQHAADASPPSDGGEGRGEGAVRKRSKHSPHPDRLPYEGEWEKQLAALSKQMQPVLDQLAVLEAALQPYEQIKQQLAEARARYRTLTAEFVDELKSRCDAMNADQKRALVLELFAQDVQAGLAAAVAEKRQQLVRFIEGLWDKYRVTLTTLRDDRSKVEALLGQFLGQMRYV